jgi:AP-4 complex subunit mu-1
MFTQKNGLYFIVTSRYNVSPVMIFETLGRCVTLFKDFTGQLSEESLRKNFTLVYEILDELFDNGHIQSTMTNNLTTYVFNEPVLTVDVPTSVTSMLPIQIMEQRTVKSTATCRPITDKNNEIFVDILERINAEFGGDGALIRSEIVGSIVMKSYLTGSPLLRLGLNNDLIIGQNTPDQNVPYGGITGGVYIDYANFCDFAQMGEFENQRVISLYPQDGEFTLMNYRVADNYRHDMPFRVSTTINTHHDSAYKLEVLIKIRADIPKTSHASNVFIRVPVPKTTDNVNVNFGSVGLSTHTHEYKSAQKVVLWGVKKFVGSTEQYMRLNIVLSEPIKNFNMIKKQVGPVSMKFEIPMHNVSGVQLRFLKIGLDEIQGKTSSSKSTVKRWVRYVTQANSFVSRVFKEGN